MEDNVIVVDNTEESGRRHHYHHHHHHHSTESRTKKSASVKKTFSHKWRKFCKKVFKIEGKKEISVMLVIVFLMALVVPVVIAIIDAINRFFMGY